MRFVILGAGAVGGVAGGRLHQSGHDVTLVARGPHFEAIAAGGLTLESPAGTDVLQVPVADRVDAVAWDDETVAVLAVKSQDTVGMLDALEAALSRAGSSPPAAVVCLQNGVDNERQVLRRYAQCYGICVMLPATHLEPGVVQAHSAPITGLLDIGCFPTGVDDTARRIAEALSASTFDSRAVPEVMRFKYRKLLMNLLNAVEALCGPAGRGSRELVHLVLDEGEAVLAVAGIDVASRGEDAERRGSLLKLEGTASGPWSGGSSWQSVARGTGRIEADYLNGEICLVGRLHGVATPVNARLQQLAGAAARGEVDGPMSPDDLLAQLRG